MSRVRKKAFLINWKISFQYLFIVNLGLNLFSFFKHQRLILRYLIICCCVFSCAVLSASDKNIYQSQAQQIYFNHLDAEKYTINPVIYAIEQDNQGYIWFGTQHGLSRFDGVNIRHYNREPSDENSIINNWIFDVHSDKKGRLWVASRDGINLYLPENDRFRVYKKGQQYPGINGINYQSIAESSNGTMWFGSQNNGLTSYDVHTDKFTSFQYDEKKANSLGHNSINDLLIDKNDTLWIATGGGLNVKFNASDEFQHFTTSSELTIPSNKIRTLFEDKEGLIWVGTADSGLFLFDMLAGVSRHFFQNSNNGSDICSNIINDINQDKQGRIWLATPIGLCELHIESQTFTLHTHNTGRVSSLIDDRVLSLFQDKGGVMWVGTMGGVNSWNADLNSFTHISQNFGLGKSMSSNVITAFAQDSRENVYIGTHGGGVNQFIPTTKQIIQILVNDDVPRGLKDNRVMSLLVDSKDNLWVGTVSKGLFKRHSSETDFENFQTKSTNNTSISSNSISKIVELSDGTIAVGTYGGGMNLLQDDGKFLRFKHDENDPTSISSNLVLDIVEGDEGSIWIATIGGGLNRYLPKQGRIEHFKVDQINVNSLPSNDLTALLDTPKYLWIATQGTGLARLDKQQLLTNKTFFTRFTVNDGLPSNVVYGLLNDDKDNIWISHSRGISTLSHNDLSIRSFNTSHGLQGLDFNSGAYFKSSNGRMFFGGANGFNTFLPNEVEINRYDAPVRLTEFSKFDRAVPLHNAFKNNGVLQLNYSDSVFGFEFAALDYTNPSDNLYQYKMEGMHDKWIKTNGNNRISFFNLPDGQYTFRVKGANNDAYWSNQELMIPVIILPPPWKTWWAYTIYVFALFFLVITFIRVQRRKVQFERNLNIELEKKVDERTKSLHQANVKLQEISVTDQLTGLKNRRFLLNNLKEDIGLVLRKYHEKSLNSTKEVIKESDLIFFLIDLDHFKQVNDVYGHTAGDAVLVQIKSILEQVFRETDYLVRWGGEEFLVVARYSERVKAPQLAERLRQSVEEHDFNIGQGEIIKKTCSIGFAIFPFLVDKPEYLSWERVVDIADHCLYSAKKSARNAWIGLDNIDCSDDDLIENITKNTKALLDSNRLKVATSLNNLEEIIWN